MNKVNQENQNAEKMSFKEKIAGLKRYQLAFILFIILMIAYVDRVHISILVVDMPFLVDMGIANTPSAKGLLMTVFLLFFGGGMLILSPLADRLGPKKSMLIATVIMCGSMATAGFVGTFLMLLVTRAILGIGEAMHYPMQSAFVRNWFPVHERGKANAIWLLGVNFAPLLAIPFFTWLVPIYGWRSAYYFLAVLGLVPIFLLWKYTVDHPRQSKTISHEELEYIEHELALEVANEEEVEATGIWTNMQEVLSNYRVWLLMLIYTGASSIYWGIVTWLPTYLKDARGFSWTEMGLLASLPYLLSIIVKLGAGHLSDKYGKPATFVLVGMASAATFITMGAFIESNYAAAVLIALGSSAIAIVSPTSWVLLQSAVPRQVVGAASGFMSGGSSLISAIAPFMVGILISITGSYVGGLMYMVIWGVLGVICTLVLMRDQRLHPEM